MKDTFTHDGIRYDLAKVKAKVKALEAKEVAVSKLKWILGEGPLDEDPETELARLELVDVDNPIIITDWEKKLVVLDGGHRLKVAVMAKLDTLPAKQISEDDLYECRSAKGRLHEVFTKKELLDFIE